MQWFGIFLFSLLGFGVKELAIRVLSGVGFGLVTYYGAFALLDQLLSLFEVQILGLPADVVSILGLMQIDVCFTIIFSAIGAKFLLRGWNKFMDARMGRVWRLPGSGGGMSA